MIPKKQCLRRKLIELVINKDQREFAMKKGILDILTIIPHDEIESKGIPYVQFLIENVIDQGDNAIVDACKWKVFWTYFKKQWLNKIPTWNVHAATTVKLNLNDRTNNGLERFNRVLNNTFPTPHPNVMTFVGGIESLSRDYVKKMDDIRNGRSKAPQRDACTIPDIPRKYNDFKP